MIILLTETPHSLHDSNASLVSNMYLVKFKSNLVIGVHNSNAKASNAFGHHGYENIVNGSKRERHALLNWSNETCPEIALHCSLLD